MRNHSYENDFDLHENETACRTHFHMKGFALRLVLKQRNKRTRKWPIYVKAAQNSNISGEDWALTRTVAPDPRGREIAREIKVCKTHNKYGGSSAIF